MRFFRAHCPLKPSPRVELPTSGFGTQVLVWGAVGTRTLTACWDSRLRRTQGPRVHTRRTRNTNFSIENVSTHPNTTLPNVLQLVLPAASLPGAGISISPLERKKACHAAPPGLPQLCSAASSSPVCHQDAQQTVSSGHADVLCRTEESSSPSAHPPSLGTVSWDSRLRRTQGPSPAADPRRPPPSPSPRHPSVAVRTPDSPVRV